MSRDVAGPIGSKLSDKLGCRAVTMAGGFLLCLGLVLCSLATQLFHVYLALGIVAGRPIKICMVYCACVYVYDVVLSSLALLNIDVGSAQPFFSSFSPELEPGQTN